MQENEILIRAREAAISVLADLADETIAEIRAGVLDNDEAIRACVAFANALDIPLSTLYPTPSPQLLAARQWAAGRLQSNGLAGEAADVRAGKADWQPLVVAFLAGAGL